MKISIAIATYNGEAFLQQQLYSFLNQTRLPDEVVISDDNSTDRTVDILNSFIQMAPFDVKLIENKENVGYKKNFERALQQVTGDLIFMSDQDDVWFEYKIERIMRYAAEYPKSKVFIHDTDLTDSKLIPTGRSKIEQLRSMGGDQRGMIMGTCTAVRKSFINLCLPIPDEITGHDDWIHLLAKLFNVRKVLHESLQYYRIHESNTSDNLANTTKKINFFKFNIINTILINQNEPKLIKRLKYNQILKKWIENNSEQKIHNNNISHFKQEEAFKFLENERIALEKRIMLYDLSIPKRIYFVLQMLLTGRYEYFSGWKSFLKDLFIRRTSKI